MDQDAYFATLTPHAHFGLNPATLGPVSEAAAIPGINQAAGPGLHNSLPLWSPENPLFWFGLLLAGSVGLVAVSSSVRVGSARVGGSLGKK